MIMSRITNKAAFHVSALLLVGLLSTACTTAEEKDTKVKGRKIMWDYETDTPVSEREIMKKIQEDPKNPQPYFMLGMHYESMNRFLQARDAYLRGTLNFQNAKGYREDVSYTGGHYCLGRVYTKLKAYPQAIAHLHRVVAKEPSKKGVAIQNSHYRESHYLLGVCYESTLDYQKSRYHYNRFRKLGGEEWRVIPRLARLDSETGAISGYKSEPNNFPQKKSYKGK